MFSFLLVLSLKRSISQLGWNGCSQGSCIMVDGNDCIPNLNKIKNLNGWFTTTTTNTNESY